MSGKSQPVSTIIKTSLEPIESLKPYHLNPRRGNTEAVQKSIGKLGQFKAIVANIGTKSEGGYTREILAGNHTWRAMKDEGHTHIMVSWVDVDDQTAKKIVVNDNRTSDLATYDNKVLSEILTSMDDLDGVAYDPFDLDQLANDLLDMNDDGPAPGSAEFADAPDDDNYAPQFAVTVICSDEAHQEQVYSKLHGQGYNCKVVTV